MEMVHPVFFSCVFFSWPTTDVDDQGKLEDGLWEAGVLHPPGMVSPSFGASMLEFHGALSVVSESFTVF